MSTTRKALFISNPGEVGEENYCKGVFEDIKNFRKLLQAAHGGFWQANEIIELSRPTKKEVTAAVRGLAPYSYSFILFSGHGWYSSVDMCNVLTLCRGHEISSNELLKDANKRTIILDSCRKVYHESITESRSMAKAMLMSEEALLRQADPYKCRALFSQLIEESSTGIIEINSCNIGETAGDDEVLGGRYSSSLIAGAENWTEQEAKKPLWASANSDSIVRAHDVATSTTQRRSGNSQNPRITKPRSGNYFPFIVYA